MGRASTPDLCRSIQLHQVWIAADMRPCNLRHVRYCTLAPSLNCERQFTKERMHSFDRRIVMEFSSRPRKECRKLLFLTFTLKPSAADVSEHTGSVLHHFLSWIGYNQPIVFVSRNLETRCPYRVQTRLRAQARSPWTEGEPKWQDCELVTHALVGETKTSFRSTNVNQSCVNILKLYLFKCLLNTLRS